MISYKRDSATHESIKQHWLGCYFKPPLDSYLDVDEYIDKILKHAERFECWYDNELAGLVAIYCNDYEIKKSFVTIVSVMGKYEGQGIAKALLNQGIEYCQKEGFLTMELEVRADNDAAVHIYGKFGFELDHAEGTQAWMVLRFKGST